MANNRFIKYIPSEKAIENPKEFSDSKRTIKTTIKSLVINPKSSGIWAIFTNIDNHQNNQEE